MNQLAVTVLIAMAAQAVDLRAAEPPKEPAITAEERTHWSFRPLQRTVVPDVKNTRWPRNAIDRFVLRRIERAGLRPAPEADRFTLIRRVTFDLIGLPPTPTEIEAFTKDRSPEAYGKLVVRLLCSPAYGERQAQHWLDLARFAETDGFEHDKVRKNAWRYRDWVVAAFNADLPYDEFVRLQLAADQIRPDDDSAHNALGFLLCGPDMPDINLQDERRHSFLNDVTSTVGSVFLGLQFGCAQCHDHKYDPISQHDFYRLRAFFDPYFRFTRYRPAGLNTPKGRPTASHLMVRGHFRRKGPVLEPEFPRIVAGGVKPKSTSLGRRRAVLAEWLTRSDHPLTTRVIVNRMWQWHFGRGLSASTSDFGVMGDEPLHAGLLDWLATELPRRNWSLKAMHRLIVTSATYRQASRLRSRDSTVTQSWKKSLAQDSGNRLWTRMTRHRLSGEAIRDAMLAASGSLSQRRGGPGVRPPLPQELLVTLLKNQWPVSKDERDHRRRSIYLFVRRNLRYPIFSVFDQPDTNASCPRRNRSTTATQSLMLLNSRFSLDAAQRLARAVVERTGTNREKQIALAFRRTLGRPPTPIERRFARKFLERDAAATQRPGNGPAALTNFCLVLFNVNEFVYVD